MSDFCDPMDCSMPGFPVHHQLLKFAQTHVHRVDDAIQPSHPLSSPSPPAFNFSHHQGLSNESILCIKWPKYWHFSFSTSPSNEYSGLIFFRTDWFELLAVQETLSKADVTWPHLKRHTWLLLLLWDWDEFPYFRHSDYSVTSQWSKWLNTKVCWHLFFVRAILAINEGKM